MCTHQRGDCVVKGTSTVPLVLYVCSTHMSCARGTLNEHTGNKSIFQRIMYMFLAPKFGAKARMPKKGSCWG